MLRRRKHDEEIAPPAGPWAWFEARGKREVTLLLFVDWDPIGVGGDAYAWQEYASCARPLVRAVLDGESDAQLAARMDAIAREQMGLGGGADLDTARRLRAWIAASLEAWADESGDAR